MALSRGTVDRLSEILDIYQYIQPENSAGERESFLAAVEENRVYNPSYTYPEFSHSGEARELLKEVEGDADSRLEKSMIEALSGRLAMIEAVGSEDITPRSREHYGHPEMELVELAKERFTTPEEDGRETLDGETLKEAFDSLFEEMGVSYRCVSAEVDIIRNSPGERKILVPEGKTYTLDAARRLLVHETTHSIRTVNGIESGKPPLAYGTKGYEVAEEGLATFNEERMGVERDSFPRITARVIAVDSADESFHSLYMKMRELGLEERPSFIRAYRVKRGLEDTSSPGGFIKDHIYFQGYSILSGRPEIADPLYAGKIGFDDLDSLGGAEPEVARSEHLEACEKVSEGLPG